MGLAIPWGLLAALAVEGLIKDRERTARNLVTAVALLTLGLSSFLWTFREIGYATMNVASTTRHPVYLGPDVQRIVRYLEDRPGRHVVVAFPGTKRPLDDGEGHAAPDAFATPNLPDVAPFLSGLAGAYTVAGHWSETPDYGRRASESTRFLLGKAVPVDAAGHEVAPMSDAERAEFVRRYGVEYAVVPVGGVVPNVAPSSLGDVVVPGSQFALVRLRD